MNPTVRPFRGMSLACGDYKFGKEADAKLIMRAINSFFGHRAASKANRKSRGFCLRRLESSAQRISLTEKQAETERPICAYKTFNSDLSPVLAQSSFPAAC
jgi:hypothetical protein